MKFPRIALLLTFCSLPSAFAAEAEFEPALEEDTEILFESEEDNQWSSDDSAASAVNNDEEIEARKKETADDALEAAPAEEELPSPEEPVTMLAAGTLEFDMATIEMLSDAPAAPTSLALRKKK